MATLSFAFNEDTLNTTIEVLDESLDVNTAILKMIGILRLISSFGDQNGRSIKKKVHQTNR